MAIKIVMERTAKPEHRDDLLELLKKLRAKAVHQPGYLAGETLCSLENPDSHLIISTWHSLQDWKNWERNTERAVLVAQIETLLQQPSRVGIFIDSAASISWHSLPEAI